MLVSVAFIVCCNTINIPSAATCIRCKFHTDIHPRPHASQFCTDSFLSSYILAPVIIFRQANHPTCLICDTCSSLLAYNHLDSIGFFVFLNLLSCLDANCLSSMHWSLKETGNLHLKFKISKFNTTKLNNDFSTTLSFQIDLLKFQENCWFFKFNPS